MVDVYALRPVNKTAGLVTSQTDCATNDELTPEQLRENLVSQVKLIEQLLLSTPKKSELRKSLGQEKFELCKQINKIRPARKCGNLSSVIVDILREELPKPSFQRLIDKATKRLRSEQEND